MKDKQFYCPFCEKNQPENCEYVDIGVGFQQCTPNCCEECGASERYPDDDGTNPNREYKDSFTRYKQ